MYDFVGKKYFFFLISLLVIIPGVVSLCLFGLNFAIDFTGGSKMTFSGLTHSNTKQMGIVRDIVNPYAKGNITTYIQGKQVVVQTPPLSSQQHRAILATLQQRVPLAHEEEFYTVGPTIGSETTQNAVNGVLLASCLIVLYIAWSFRSVPKRVGSWKFGLCAIVALLHDVLVVFGIFSLLGHFFGAQIDSLFITAILTIIGFSVHDTIVVFDRIREHLLTSNNVPFARIVNDSLTQTLTRSLNTSLTVILVLFTLLLFGGESIFWFVVALLVGIMSGTYSSIFNASMLLLVWQEKTNKG